MNTPRSLKNKIIDRNHLETCVLNILDAAAQVGVESIVIPAIGLNTHHDFNAKEVAEVMIYWIIEWCHLKDTGNLREILIANWEPEITEQFEMTIQRILSLRKAYSKQLGLEPTLIGNRSKSSEQQ